MRDVSEPFFGGYIDRAHGHWDVYVKMAARSGPNLRVRLPRGVTP